MSDEHPIPKKFKVVNPEDVLKVKTTLIKLRNTNQYLSSVNFVSKATAIKIVSISGNKLVDVHGRNDDPWVFILFRRKSAKHLLIYNYNSQEYIKVDSSVYPQPTNVDELASKLNCHKLSDKKLMVNIYDEIVIREASRKYLNNIDNNLQ